VSDIVDSVVEEHWIVDTRHEKCGEDDDKHELSARKEISRHLKVKYSVIFHFVYIRYSLFVEHFVHSTIRNCIIHEKHTN